MHQLSSFGVRIVLTVLAAATVSITAFVVLSVFRLEHGLDRQITELEKLSEQKLSRRLLTQAKMVTDPESLHQLRIVGKRLRYAMELFAGAYPSSFRDSLYPLIEQLQGLLGTVNDHAVARERFREWLRRATPEHIEAVQSLLADEEEALGASRAAFYRSLTPENTEQIRAAFESLWQSE